ncbi:DUF2971 domain-containing protein [Achromobacter xylosoxidans]
MTTLYHHTSADGLIGIITNKAIWATDIEFLNDYNEYVIGKYEITKSCEKGRSEKSLPALSTFYSALEKMIIENLDKREHFIASFTKTKDNLRQWMSYGKPNSSYAIGFRRDALEDIWFHENKKRSEQLAYQLSDVDYKSKAIAETLNPNKILQSIKDSIKRGASQDQIIRDQDQIIRDLANSLMFNCCATKDNSFVDENEVRMICQTRKFDLPYDKTKHRNQGGVITPYIDIPIPHTAIREIIIGPNINKDTAKKGVERLIKKFNIDCEITHSSCTLRQF